MAQEAKEGESFTCLDSLNAGLRSTDVQGQQGESTKEEKKVLAAEKKAAKKVAKAKMSVGKKKNTL